MNCKSRFLILKAIIHVCMIYAGPGKIPSKLETFEYMEPLIGIEASDESIKGEYKGKTYECKIVTSNAGKLDLEVYHQDKGKLDVWGELQIHIVRRIPCKYFKNLGGSELMDLVRKNLGSLDDCIALDPKVFADPDFLVRFVEEINDCRIRMLDELCNEPCQTALPNILYNLQTLLTQDIDPEKKSLFEERLNWSKYALHPQLQTLLYDDDWDKPSSNSKSLPTLFEEIVGNIKTLWDQVNQRYKLIPIPKLPYFDPVKFMYMPAFASIKLHEELNNSLLVSDRRESYVLVLDGNSIQVYEEQIALSDKQAIKIIPRIPFSQLIKLFPENNYTARQKLIGIFKRNMYNIADWLSLDPKIFEEPEILDTVIQKLNSKPDEYFGHKLISSFPQLALLNNVQNIKTVVSHQDVHPKIQLMLEDVLWAYQYNLLPKLFGIFNQTDEWDAV